MSYHLILDLFTTNIAALITGLCYNIRYFEQHGRDLKDPWSCRQSAIHQSYYFQRNLSNWTVVHPPMGFNELLRDLKMEFDFHPLGFHLQYITLAIQNWREYLDYMSLDLLSLVSNSWLFPLYWALLPVAAFIILARSH